MIQRLSPAWKQPQEEGLTRADYEGQSSGPHNCLNCQTSLTIKANCAPKYINAEAVHLRVRTKVTSMYKPANCMYLHTLIYKNVHMWEKTSLVNYNECGQTLISCVGSNKNGNKQKLHSHSQTHTKSSS